MQARSVEPLRQLADQYRGLLTADQRQAMQAIRLTEAKSVGAPSPAVAAPAQDGSSSRERLRTPDGPQPGQGAVAQAASREQLGQLRPAQTPATPKRERGGPSR